MSTTAPHGHEVSVRDLRNHGGQVLDRVVRGETLTVTKDGTPVAELRPVLRRSLPAAELIARARRAPKVDADLLRRDIDSVVDQSL
jgi:prevent-host-death family protein